MLPPADTSQSISYKVLTPQDLDTILNPRQEFAMDVLLGLSKQ